MLVILTDYFPPGYKAGGPVRSCYNLAYILASCLEVSVITRNSEWGEDVGFLGLPYDTWIETRPRVRVYYASPSHRSYSNIVKIIGNNKSTVLYLTGMFSLPFTIYPILAHWIGRIDQRIVLAPRGMLKASALQFKPLKKELFLTIFRLLGWHKQVVFHATDKQEVEDIQRVFGLKSKILQVAQVPDIALFEERPQPQKALTVFKICTLGRVHPIKNILQSIQWLISSGLKNVHWDIIGPLEDANYAEECRALINNAPNSWSVHFHGEMPPAHAHEYLKSADFFYLLTQGENFGHAIYESLALGKPVIISDQTPWRALSTKMAGWDLSLNNPIEIQDILIYAAQMSEEEYRLWSDGAHKLAKVYAESTDWVGLYRNLFGI